MRVFLFIVILVGLTYLGWLFTKKYKDRLVFYKDMITFCNILSNQIKFSKNNLSTIVQAHLNSFSPKFKITVENLFIKKEQYAKIEMFTEEENVAIKTFFNGLGKYDVEGEVNNIKNHKSQIENHFNNAQEQYKKFGPLGTKLGFITGLLICIILI